MSTAKYRQEGNLRYYLTSDTGPTSVRLTRCPACGKAFTPGKPREVPTHIATHGPEDFGLTP